MSVSSPTAARSTNSPAEPTSPQKAEDVREIGLGKAQCSYNGKSWELRLVAASVTPLQGVRDGKRDRLMFISCVGSDTAIKGIETLLRLKPDEPGTLQLFGDATTTWKVGVCTRDPAFSYDIQTSRISKTLTHLVATTTRRGFMTSFTNRALWNCLSSDEYTTPVLRTWMKTLAEEFLRKKLLIHCQSYQCSGVFLDLSPRVLDATVCELVRLKKLMLRE